MTCKCTTGLLFLVVEVRDDESHLWHRQKQVSACAHSTYGELLDQAYTNIAYSYAGPVPISTTIGVTHEYPQLDTTGRIHPPVHVRVANSEIQRNDLELEKMVPIRTEEFGK
ncbi:5978_t:CDS:2, partial [Paraglomus occultum]